ncbi:hypothetical protein [Streptomyces halstedii]|uniref:hypothetical protein n=1 Tax=Streptomyces halstedii TaxID=1944 RepID=UPI001EF17B79|nr:hypothetical protein [Streptomyces halstedii]
MRTETAARPRREKVTKGALGAVAAGALAWAAVVGTPADGAEPQPVTLIASEGPGYAVEDFTYPSADKILAEQGVLLKRGDGHITLARCDSEPDLLEVWPRDNGKVCFRLTGNEGYLSLEIPAVYGIKGNTYVTQVDMTVGKEEKTFDIVKNTWTPVGETADEHGRDYMLVEIRAAK